MAKEKKIIQLDPEDSPTVENKLEINVLVKNFPYLVFMDKELMTPTCLEQLPGGWWCPGGEVPMGWPYATKVDRNI